jgi:hypothetical protein
MPNHERQHRKRQARGQSRAGDLVSSLSLSVVIDGRSDPAGSAEVARLVTRLDLGGVWLRQPPLTGTGLADPVAFLSHLAADVAAVQRGLIVDTDVADRLLLDALTQTALPGDGPVRALRVALTGSPAGVAGWQQAIAERSALAGVTIAVPAAEASRLALDRPGLVFVPFAASRDLDAAVNNAAAAAAGRPVLVEVAVSIGRTTAEAQARAAGEELFALVGHPGRMGLFGTLEECQGAAASLAHAGAAELVCYLPRSADLPDVLAQLRAMAVGASALRPGEPPSTPPPPPVGWGGRRAVI